MLGLWGDVKKERSRVVSRVWAGRQPSGAGSLSGKAECACLGGRAGCAALAGWQRGARKKRVSADAEQAVKRGRRCSTQEALRKLGTPRKI